MRKLGIAAFMAMSGLMGAFVNELRSPGIQEYRFDVRTKGGEITSVDLGQRVMRTNGLSKTTQPLYQFNCGMPIKDGVVNTHTDYFAGEFSYTPDKFNFFEQPHEDVQAKKIGGLKRKPGISWFY